MYNRSPKEYIASLTIKLSGAVWPPYESAGQGYWARQAGFSLPFEQQGTQQQTYHHQPAQGMGQVRENQQQFYATHMVNGQAYWVPRQQQQHTYTTEHQQQQLPVIAFTQAVELTADQLRAQQRGLMHKYLISTGNGVLTSTVHPTILMGATGQNLYRYISTSPFFDCLLTVFCYWKKPPNNGRSPWLFFLMISFNFHSLFNLDCAGSASLTELSRKWNSFKQLSYLRIYHSGPKNGPN